MRRCAYQRCGGQLPTLARADAKFCSGRCRVAAHRERHGIPGDLTSRARWVRYDRRKVPLRVSGPPASSTDPKTWSSYAAVRRSRAGVGVGFVLNGDGIVCLDVDHCLTREGRPRQWVRPLLERLPATYVEVSPSGDGLHIWGHGSVTRGRKVPVPGGTVEVYGSGRYLTVTARRFGSAPSRLADLSAVLESLG